MCTWDSAPAGIGGERAASAPGAAAAVVGTHTTHSRCDDEIDIRRGEAGGGGARWDAADHEPCVPGVSHHPQTGVRRGVPGCDSSRPRRPRPRRPGGAPEQAVGPVEGLTPPPLAPPRAHKKKPPGEGWGGTSGLTQVHAGEIRYDPQGPGVVTGQMRPCRLVTRGRVRARGRGGAPNRAAGALPPPPPLPRLDGRGAGSGRARTR